MPIFNWPELTIIKRMLHFNAENRTTCLFFIRIRLIKNDVNFVRRIKETVGADSELLFQVYKLVRKHINERDENKKPGRWNFSK